MHLVKPSQMLDSIKHIVDSINYIFDGVNHIAVCEGLLVLATPISLRLSTIEKSLRNEIPYVGTELKLSPGGRCPDSYSVAPPGDWTRLKRLHA